MTRASYTLTVGIVMAGLIVGSSMILRVGPAPLAYGGLILALVLGLALLWRMFRG